MINISLDEENLSVCPTLNERGLDGENRSDLPKTFNLVVLSMGICCFIAFFLTQASARLDNLFFFFSICKTSGTFLFARNETMCVFEVNFFGFECMPSIHVF